MADFGVTDTGFNAKRLADIISEAESDLSQIEDPETGEKLQPDLNSSDPAMQIAKVPLDGSALTWEAIEIAYDQFDPAKSTGPALSSLVQINGLERQEATASTVTLDVTGTALLTIAAGQTVSDQLENNTWTTDADFTFDGGGLATVTATSTVTGPVTGLASTITKIVTPVAGWTTVNNPSDATLGRDEETDSALRRRRDQSTLAPAAGPAEAVFSNLLNVDDVTYARVLINNTLSTDARGIPAKSIGAVVLGGSDQDIAETLLARVGVGVDYFGTDTLQIFDKQGEPYDIKWIRPTEINIFIQVDLTILDSNLFPVDGDDQIKSAILAYAQGGAPALGIDDGFNETGFTVGEDVILTRLYTPVNSVPGHRIDDLQIGLSFGTLGTSDITIDFDEVSKFLTANITVNT